MNNIICIARQATDAACGGALPVLPAGLAPTERALIDDSTIYSEYNTELCWVIAKTLYEQITNDTALLDTGTDVRTFYAAKGGGATGALVRLEKLEQTALQPDSATAAELAAVQDSMANIQLTLARLDSIRSALADSTQWPADSIESDTLVGLIYAATKAGTYSTDTALWYSIDSFITTIVSSTPDSNTVSAMDSQIIVWDSVYAVYNATANGLVKQIDSTRRSRAAMVADSANAITTTVDIEWYYKQAYLIYLSTIAQDTTFDSAQIAKLYCLAFLCPAKAGKAVWMARSMLALIVDTTYNDSLLCAIDTGSYRMLWVSQPDTIQADSAKTKQNIQIVLYPNPANNYAILQLSQDVTPLQLQIINAEGQIVINQSIITSGGFYTINTSGYADGLYAVSLYSNGGKLFSQKLSIFR